MKICEKKLRILFKKSVKKGNYVHLFFFTLVLLTIHTVPNNSI